ncbi:response regulator [Tahibacter amnicola]|uniref:Response regulator transcription factor n=1 Tax=Tahibacter amnicola TaxID=2976241 RepID=A0ABY6BFJ8_9GAMM|nr:response regulator transcription factor [Tahibacter amnicola]UXI67135.1 response regulator transcription factor [Tahibacter amnicola]
MISVVLIDDHALVRHGLRSILEKYPEFSVVGEAGDGEEGLALMRRLQPDIAVLDLHMPRLTGIEVTERARKLSLRTRIVIVTVAGDSPYPRRLLEAGAVGYVPKACPEQELLQALHQVADGRRYLASAIAQQLAMEAVSGGSRSPFDALSARELEIAIRLAQGDDARTLSRVLSISEKTISTHKSNVFAKLDIDNVVALAHLAQLHGILDSGSARETANGTGRKRPKSTRAITS